MTVKETINLLRKDNKESFLDVGNTFATELISSVQCDTTTLVKYFCNALDYEHDELVQIKEKKEQLEKDNSKLTDKNAALLFEVSKLKEALEISNKALSHFNGHYVQRELVHNGHKPAYKEKVSAMEVKELLDKGYSITKIAETLGVSRTLVYRRIKELNKIKET